MTPPAARLHRLGGSGPDLLFVHGFGADRLSWAANAPQLTDAATVWTVDLPGHGSAPDAVGDGSAQALADAVARALPDLSGPALIVGHSLGGTVALHLAAAVPQVVRHLVLIAPAGPDGDAVRADAQRLRARGFTVIVGTTQGDAFDQLVECFAP